MSRVGRTARLGRQGESFLFLLPSEMEFLGQLGLQGVEVKQAMVSTYLGEVLPEADRGRWRKSSRVQVETEEGMLENHKGALQTLAKVESFVGSQVVIFFLMLTVNWFMCSRSWSTMLTPCFVVVRQT